MRILIAAVVLLPAVCMTANGGSHAGKAAYDRACKSCHGADGTPNPPMAKALQVEMRPLGAKEVQVLSDQELKDAITKGIGKMRAVKNMPDAEVSQVVAYMRTFKK